MEVHPAFFIDTALPDWIRLSDFPEITNIIKVDVVCSFSKMMVISSI